MKTTTIVALLISITILWGCKKEKKSTIPSARPSNIQNVMNSNARILDTSAITSMTATSLVLNKNSINFIPAAGDILLAPPSAKDTLGLLVKIRSLAANGNIITCSTQISNLTEAFEQLSINYTYTGAYSANARANFLNPYLQSHKKNYSLNSSGGITLTIPFNNKNIDGFILNGKLQLNIPGPKIKYVKVKGSTIPDTVLIEANINTNGSQLEITSPKLTLHEVTLHTFNLPTLFVPVTIGPLVIPIPFTQTVKINILPASVTGNMSLKILPQISATLGLSYENGTWKNLSTYSIQASADSIIKSNFSASMIANATIFDPVYTIAPFGSEDNNLFFEIPNDLNLTIQTAKPNYLLTYDLNVTAGINTSFWDGLIKGRLTLNGTLFTDTVRKGNFTPDVFVSEIIDNNPGDLRYGKSVVEFIYQSDKLVKALQYNDPNDSTAFEIDQFHYNSSGQLSSVSLSTSKNGIITAGTRLNKQDEYLSSTITYNGNNIGEIKFFKANNILGRDIKLTYQNGSLIKWVETGDNSYQWNYEYDSKNNVNKILYYENGQYTGFSTISSFDNKNNVWQAIPLNVYFYFDSPILSYDTMPGLNNAASNVLTNANGTSSGSFAYGYIYNNWSYPSIINTNFNYTGPNGSNHSSNSYKYQYFQIN